MSKMRFYLRERLDTVKHQLESQLQYGRGIKTWQKILVTFLVLYVFWIILLGSTALPPLVLGAGICTLLSFFTYDFFTKDIRVGENFFSRLLMFVFVYIPELAFIFLFRIIEANVNVARHVILMDINPGIVRIDTTLRSQTAVTALANIITLTPGTLTLDVKETLEGNALYVHWIDVETLSTEEAGEIIKGGVDEWLRRFFW
ncbi:MAG: Na+/H+ antiporter subunit E [Theionarchaea archaeon]|nr:Na+/H+ antiporter subunit E [Theionarchaea archaeon]MBU7000266.1 Na+/H+ antiporter subunit E [Theionarchaea archaeon]MBU7022067.1 Na+/H+ antiporter subunit E [Theionarchaea archaeon]MBU7034749.1 Na+/H+ antiporter subunit E [Theionarchaea archaeon]MBU7040464.1 Na+/H+ antiporter subunit E [Theionarchaea archaeon]